MCARLNGSGVNETTESRPKARQSDVKRHLVHISWTGPQLMVIAVKGVMLDMHCVLQGKHEYETPEVLSAVDLLASVSIPFGVASCFIIIALQLDQRRSLAHQSSVHQGRKPLFRWPSTGHMTSGAETSWGCAAEVSIGNQGFLYLACCPPSFCHCSCYL